MHDHPKEAKGCKKLPGGVSNAKRTVWEGSNQTKPFQGRSKDIF